MIKHLSEWLEDMPGVSSFINTGLSYFIKFAFMLNPESTDWPVTVILQFNGRHPESRTFSTVSNQCVQLNSGENVFKRKKQFIQLHENQKQATIHRTAYV